MGLTVSLTFRESRGTNNPGDPITDPKEAFLMLLDHEYDTLQTGFNQASQEQKDEVIRLFDDYQVFDAKSEAEMWLSEHDDLDKLADILIAIGPLLHGGCSGQGTASSTPSASPRWVHRLEDVQAHQISESFHTFLYHYG